MANCLEESTSPWKHEFLKFQGLKKNMSFFPPKNEGKVGLSAISDHYAQNIEK